MIELLFAGILLATNIGFFLYLNHRLNPQRLLETTLERVEDEGVLDKIAASFITQGVIAGAEIWENGGEEFALSFRDTLIEKVKMSLLGQKGGVASGDARQMQMLEGAALNDFLHTQQPLLGLIAKQFPSVMEAIEENPSLVRHIPQLLENYGVDVQGLLQQFMGGQGGQHLPQPKGSNGQWWTV